ncbi:leucine-rich repeat-containing protein 40 isoform X1 [Orussus abietinus]|uniref:leucine-rich repeat-containing protein 40 isoform X1 n=1 Tax=Orussus abietinus TaxID=222816 RepID=UPI00062609DC|nr:leucine-rich repeat-containing protein 40 isoform X1 [Orussus abietinus]
MNSTRKKINHQSVFKPRTKCDDNSELSSEMIISARKTGQLNLSSRGLATVPLRVWNIHEWTDEEMKHVNVAWDSQNEGERWWEQEPLKTLNLSCNSLIYLDSKIELLSEICNMDLHDNLLETVPPEMGNLNKLQKLDMSTNKLETLPSNFFNLYELRYLDLHNNALKELDAAVGDLIMLEYMNISCNNLTNLPVGMGYLVRLVSLDLSHNKLKELPPDIMSMRGLKKLDVSFNHLEILPPFGELRKLEVLVLRENNLRIFPDTTGCIALRELHLANNCITEINVPSLESMGKLRALTLGNNNIEVIPEEIIQLLNLEHLDLSCNNISIVPTCISIMPNLQVFIIEGNEVKNVRRDIIKCGTSRVLRHLRQNIIPISSESRLSPLLGTDDSTFPDKYCMKRTKLLSLTSRNLRNIPETVFDDAIEAQVTCIDLSKNKLCILQNKLRIIATVTDLKLSHNQLSLIPDWIGENLKHLQHLDLSNNQLSSLPDSFSLLKFLREINISFNRFTKVPDCLYTIDALEILLADTNQIIEIDVASLAQLKRLATLDLSNNNIGFVPPELGNLKNLRTLIISGNCFKLPRHATLMKGTDEILAYLRDRIPT